MVDELIDWDDFENDPKFKIYFPQKNSWIGNILVSNLLKSSVDNSFIGQAVDGIRPGLNPHPAGQLECNIPELDGKEVNGIQHKYRETMLVFPAQGQSNAMLIVPSASDGHSLQE